MKFWKTLRFYLWIAFYITQIILIYLIYFFRENLIVFSFLIAIASLILIIAMFLSAKYKIKKDKEDSNYKINSKNEIINFAKKKKILINDDNYLNTFIYNNKIILETYDWEIFTPLSKTKRGKKLRNTSEVIDYLDLISNKRRLG